MLKKVLLDYDYYEDLLATQKKYESLQKKPENRQDSQNDKEGHGLISLPKVPEIIDNLDQLPASTSENVSVPLSASKSDKDLPISVSKTPNVTLSPDDNVSISRLELFLPKKSLPKAKRLLQKFSAIGIEVKNTGDVFINGLLFSEGNGISLIRHFVAPRKNKIPINFKEFSKILNDHGIEGGDSKLRSDRHFTPLRKEKVGKFWWWLGNL